MPQSQTAWGQILFRCLLASRVTKGELLHLSASVSPVIKQAEG